MIYPPAIDAGAGPGPAAGWIVRAWAKRATSFASLFGGPVYLVGSALVEADPTDIDLRVPLHEHDLQRLFGDDGDRDPDGLHTKRELRMWRENLKQSRRWSRATGGRNIDFQVQTVKLFEGHPGKRLRIDHFPDSYFSAGLADP